MVNKDGETCGIWQCCKLTTVSGVNDMLSQLQRLSLSRSDAVWCFSLLPAGLTGDLLSSLELDVQLSQLLLLLALAVQLSQLLLLLRLRLSPVEDPVVGMMLGSREGHQTLAVLADPPQRPPPVLLTVGSLPLQLPHELLLCWRP